MKETNDGGDVGHIFKYGCYGDHDACGRKVFLTDFVVINVIMIYYEN